MDKQTFDRQFEEFVAQSAADGRFSPQQSEQWPVLDEDTSMVNFNHAYIMHCAWAARILARTKPAEHIDIGSSVYFSTMLSAFIPTSFCEFRPTTFKLTGLSNVQADLTSLWFSDNSIESLSCMHALEHVGLGRYGDSIDATGDRKSARELARVLTPGGQLLIVLPLDVRPRVEFNGHRFYSYDHVIELFNGLRLNEFSLTKELSILQNASPSDVVGQECGCFVFTKEKP